MQQINLTMDAFSIVLCLILIGCSYFDRRSDSAARYFFLMCICNLGMLIGDLPNWTCEGTTAVFAVLALQWGSLLYFAFSAPLLLFFTGYLIHYLIPKVHVRPFYWRAACILCIMQLVCSLVSLQNGMYFHITPDNYYRRGDWFWLSQAIPIALFLLNAVLIYRYRAQLRRRELFFLTSYILLPIAAETIQIVFYGVALMNAATTLALLLVYINIQLQRELYLEQQERRLAESRIDIMLSQIQPHFLYNTLTAIQQLCETDPRQAKQATLDFSRFLRANMNSLTSKAPIPFAQELNHVETYLSLERRRFPNRLQVCYETSVNNFSLPPLTLQPIVENAVRHGVLRREEGGCVTIRTEETDRAFLIIVSDDGVGFQAPADDRLHVGIENVRSRLEALCGGALFINSTPGVGTRVTITLPKEINP